MHFPPAILGYTITDNLRVKSHYDALKSIPADQLKDLVSVYMCNQ